MQKEQIFVKGLDGKTKTVELEMSASICYLALLIEDRTGVPAHLQRLIYSGWQLERGRKLSDYNIQCNSTIHLVLRALGGDVSQPHS